VFEMPTGDDFMPFLEKLAPSAHGPVDTQDRTVDTMPESEGGYLKEKTDRQILTEEILGEMRNAWPSEKAEDKKARQDAMFACFGTRSWTQVEKRTPINGLREGLAKLKAFIVEHAYQTVEDDPDGKAELAAAMA